MDQILKFRINETEQIGLFKVFQIDSSSSEFPDTI